MIVFDEVGNAVVEWELECVRAGEKVSIGLEHFLLLVKTSTTEADFRRRLFESPELKVSWRTDEQKIARRRA